MSKGKRDEQEIFIASYPTEEEAARDFRRMAAELTRRGLTKTHSVKIEKRKGVYWVLCIKK